MPWYDERHALRRLKAEVDVAISAGETEFTPFGLRTMWRGLVDYLIIDSTWAGGLTVWRKAAVMGRALPGAVAAHHDPQIHVHAVAPAPTGFISSPSPTRAGIPSGSSCSRAPEDRRGFMAVPDRGARSELRPDTLEKYGLKLG